MIRIDNQNANIFADHNQSKRPASNKPDIKSLISQIESEKFNPLNLDMQDVKSKDKPKNDKPKNDRPRPCSFGQYLPTHLQPPSPKPKNEKK